MTRKLKAFGLTLTAALAVSAVAASAASAESFAFHSEIEHTNLTGSGEGTSSLVVDAGTLKCNTAKYEGTMTSQESTSLALSPLFESCTMSGGTADVSMNGCQFVLTASTKEGGTYKATMDISCSEGKSIAVVATVAGVTKCTIHVPAQTLSGATVSEVSEGDIKAVASIAGINYSQTAGTGIGKCSNAESTTNGAFEGAAVIAGSLGEVSVNIAMQALNPVLLVESPIQFGGLNTERTIKIENKSGQDLKKGLKYFVVNPDGNEFQLTEDTCNNGIAKDKSCQVKLKCTKAPAKIARFITETQAPDPHGIGAAKLEGC